MLYLCTKISILFLVHFILLFSHVVLFFKFIYRDSTVYEPTIENDIAQLSDPQFKLLNDPFHYIINIDSSFKING